MQCRMVHVLSRNDDIIKVITLSALGHVKLKVTHHGYAGLKLSSQLFLRDGPQAFLNRRSRMIHSSAEGL